MQLNKKNYIKYDEQLKIEQELNISGWQKVYHNANSSLALKPWSFHTMFYIFNFQKIIDKLNNGPTVFVGPMKYYP